MKIKLISLSLLLVAISACASTATKSNESLQLMDGSYLSVNEGKAVRIVDNTGEAVIVKKGAMMELANGNYIYINQDGSVNKIKTDNHSHRKNANSSSGHSH